jgi:very-short-patch-repair endonuclease
MNFITLMSFGLILVILFLLLEKRLWEKEVESKKILSTKKGEKVQSYGEVKIADWLFEHNIEYEYDQEKEIASQFIRPDFYLSRENVVIEYWGLMKEEFYQKSRKRKEELYGIEGMTLISIETEDIATENVDNILSSYLEKKEGV